MLQVLPEGISLGKWLVNNGLPVLKVGPLALYFPIVVDGRLEALYSRVASVGKGA